MVRFWKRCFCSFGEFVGGVWRFMFALDGFDDRFLRELLSLLADGLGVVGGVH